MSRLGTDLLIREMKNVRPILGVLDRNRADVSAAIEVNLRVLVEIPGLGNVASLELDVESCLRVGVVISALESS